MALRYSSLILAAIGALIQPGMSSPACPARTSTTKSTSTTPTPTGPPTLPASCTYRPQATSYQTTGCDFTCPPQSAWCIADAYVVLPCGCDRAAVSPTTVTRCPTASANCFQCSTGWGIATITDSNCPPSATASATAA
ncbi:hypothetical protein C8A01DRAFT_46122 [Parachaetomium inaequale]|uniref:Uncharacterized protein n=1 Tax=Parachaetomium inaequale TaxID=2588326 RepID=A0AAN6SS48_9PEZI|nr:hypothetical protein C8A01DRAFT_46122 [Parachaetomium inaequale]